MKEWKYPIIAVAIVGLSLGGLYFFLKANSGVEQKTGGAGVVEQKDRFEPGNEGPGSGSTVDVGTREVSRGNFERVAEGKIYYSEGGTTKELPLTVDEVVLSCTTQDLSAATGLDFDQVVEVNIETPGIIGSKIPVGEPIVVFASEVDGVWRAHTVAMADTSCPQE